MDLISREAIALFLGYVLRGFLGRQLAEYTLEPLANKFKDKYGKPWFAWLKDKFITTEREAAMIVTGKHITYK